SAVFVYLPVHPGGGLIVDLHSIHPAVSFAGLRILCEHHRHRYEAPTVLGPAFDYRKIEQRELSFAENFLFARPVFYDLWKHFSEVGEPRNHFYFFDEALRRLDVGEFQNSFSDLAVIVDPESSQHSAATPERVDQNGNRVAFYVFEEQRGAV